MRPVGTVRAVLGQAAQALADECGGGTWRDLAERAGVGYRVACMTVRNMERAGVLARVGAEKRAHSRRWMAVYVPHQACAPGPAGDLDKLMRTWPVGPQR